MRSHISKLVTSRFFQKCCSSGVVSAFPLRKTIDFTDFFRTFRDTAVAHEQDFYHLFYSSYVLYFFSNACYYPIAKSLKHLCSLICFRRSRPCFPPMSSLVTGSCNTADAISKSNGFLRIRSLSPAIWNAGLRTHRIGCSELSPLPLT